MAALSASSSERASRSCAKTAESTGATTAADDGGGGNFTSQQLGLGDANLAHGIEHIAAHMGGDERILAEPEFEGAANDVRRARFERNGGDVGVTECAIQGDLSRVRTADSKEAVDEAMLRFDVRRYSLEQRASQWNLKQIVFFVKRIHRHCKALF
jgi:hypothetical protein